MIGLSSGYVISLIFSGTIITQTGSLSLDDAIAIADKQAFSVLAQKSAVRKAKARVNEAAGNLFPKVTVAGNYSRYDKEQQGGSGSGSGGGFSGGSKYIDSKNVSVSLNQSIDISGNVGRAVRAVKDQQRAAEATLQASFNDARLSVRTSYFSVLRAQAQVKVAEQTLADNQERFNQAEKNFRADQIAKVDVMRFQSQVDQSKSDLITAQNSLQLAKNSFNNTLARPIDEPVTLIEPEALPLVRPELATLVDSAYARRPEIKALVNNLDALTQIRIGQETALNPSLNVALTHSRAIDLPKGSFQQDQSTVGVLSVSWPIWDSGINKAKVAEAREDEAQAQILLDQTKLAVSQEVRSARKNLESADARLKNAEEQIKLAEEVYRLSKVKNDVGVGTYVEVIDAETQVTQARNGLVNARYDYLTSYSQLQRAIGTDDIDKVTANTGRTDNLMATRMVGEKK